MFASERVELIVKWLPKFNSKHSINDFHLVILQNSCQKDCQVKIVTRDSFFIYLFPFFYFHRFHELFSNKQNSRLLQIENNTYFIDIDQAFYDLNISFLIKEMYVVCHHWCVVQYVSFETQNQKKISSSNNPGSSEQHAFSNFSCMFLNPNNCFQSEFSLF